MKKVLDNQKFQPKTNDYDTKSCLKQTYTEVPFKKKTKN